MSRITDEPYFTYSAYSALTSGIQVKCPKCHSAGVVTADDDNAYFRYLELWFLTSFQGKPVWALNREHLAYLIDYLSADLREKPMGRAKKTQADHLPTFMKTAKNRERIVKLLKKMQEEWGWNKNLTETELEQITSMDGTPLDVRDELR